ncbi:MAG: hypothetical protein GY950_19535, partial [bacterium]|nr:hypothetical protein [bacterium]
METRGDEMDFKKLALDLVDTTAKYRHVLIYIKGSPDPDAIAASYVLKLICEHFAVNADIYSPVYPSLPQNIKMIKDLQLPIRFEVPENGKNRYDAYAITDHQSVTVESLTGVMPCALHIDHHEPVEEKIPVDLDIVMQEAGSTSTIMIFIMKELEQQLNLDKALRVKTATALYYGIQTDTDDFQHAEDLDKEALKLIAADCDRELLYGLSSTPYSRESMNYFNMALQNQVVYKDWLITG